MKKAKGKRALTFYSIAILVLMSLICGILSFEYMDDKDLAIKDEQKVEAPAGNISIVIKISQRLLEVYNDGVLHKKYRIAVGKNETPTPIGEWNVVWKAYNWGSGFGTRWMGLNVPWGIYGIHGTNKPWSVGQFASHGCIRMRNKDVEELFEWVPIGASVRIEGRKILVERTLHYEMTGSDVAVLQMKLKELGYFTGRADGIFGLKTKEAVENFQSSQGFEVTGVVNRNLADLLGI